MLKSLDDVIGGWNMPILICRQCQAKNRVAGYRLDARATCGKCRAFLIEPMWLTISRDLLLIFRKYWILFTSAMVLVMALLVQQNKGTPSQDIPARVNAAPSWTPAPAQIPSPSPHQALQLAPIVPVVMCVPVNVSSGAKKLYTHSPALAPLSITTPPDDNFVFRIVKNGTKKYVMSIYMAGGDTREFKVPLGTYSIYVAQGQTWCGHDVAFGRSSTRYTRLDGTFAFTRDAQAYNGHRIELVPQIMGNLDSKEVSANEFSELVPEGMSGSDHASQ